MKYAVLKIVNGNFLIDSEWNTDVSGAIMQWHAVCRALRNDSQTQSATVKVIDEQGNLYEGYKEFISPIPVNA